MRRGRIELDEEGKIWVRCWWWWRFEGVDEGRRDLDGRDEGEVR